MNIGNIILQSTDKNAYFQRDRSRTGGMLATYKVNDDLTLAFGASMMTGEANREDDHTQGNPNYYPNEEKYGKNAGKMVGTHKEETNPNLRSGIFYAGAIYKGQATFFGENRESRLHSIQNYIYKNMVHYTPYFADLESDANSRSFSYFYNKTNGNFSWDFYNHPLSDGNRYWKVSDFNNQTFQLALSNSLVSASWYDYSFGIPLPFITAFFH